MLRSYDERVKIEAAITDVKQVCYIFAKFPILLSQKIVIN